MLKGRAKPGGTQERSGSRRPPAEPSRAEPSRAGRTNVTFTQLKWHFTPTAPAEADLLPVCARSNQSRSLQQPHSAPPASTAAPLYCPPPQRSVAAPLCCPPPSVQLQLLAVGTKGRRCRCLQVALRPLLSERPDEDAAKASALTCTKLLTNQDQRLPVRR